MFNQILGGEEKRVGKWAAISLMLLSAFLLVQVIINLKRLPNEGETYPQSTIMATGEGEAFAIPDIASFSFTVQESGESAESAQRLLDGKVNVALTMIKNAGVEEKDIKTTSYNVYPKYEWEQVYCVQMVGAYCPPGKNVLVGYEVSQTVSIKIRKVDMAGELVNKVGSSGISNISGVDFTIDDRDRYVAEAREAAIKEAKEEAKLLAKQLGVKLGKIMYYNDNGNYPVPYYDGYGERGGGDIQTIGALGKAMLPTGETKITSSVTITYEIK
ncbi:MAG: SIMPL domain-containing protein [Patescibacteria group bacterium]